MTDLTLTEFESSLTSIPWFRCTGQPLGNLTVRFIHSWDEWPGPEDDKVSTIHFRQQALHDEILAADPSRRTELNMLFQRVSERVVILASEALSLDLSQHDAWHAPSTAVWHAGWTAGLIALCLATNRAVPTDIESQWNWFSKGRWPSALVSPDTEMFYIY